MNAIVLDTLTHAHNKKDAAWQAYLLAKAHYRAVCKTYDARNPLSIAAFQSAMDRKNAAWDVFMEAGR